jgi:hypothetical protein
VWLIISTRARGSLLTSTPATPLLFGAIAVYQTLVCSLLIVTNQLHPRDVALILAWNGACVLLLVDPLKVALLHTPCSRTQHGGGGSERTAATENDLL